MLERFGLNEQAKLKKDMEERADNLLERPIAIQATAKQKMDEATTAIREIEEFSVLATAFSQSQLPDQEGRQKTLDKLKDNPMIHKPVFR